MADPAGPTLDDARRRATRQDPAPLPAIIDAGMADAAAVVAQVRAALDEMEQL